LGFKMNLSEKQNAEKGFPFLRGIVPFPGPAHGSYPPFPLAFSMIFISGKNGNGGTVRRPPFLSPSVSRPPGFFSDGFTRRDPPSPKRGIPFAFFPHGCCPARVEFPYRGGRCLANGRLRRPVSFPSDPLRLAKGIHAGRRLSPKIHTERSGFYLNEVG